MNKSKTYKVLHIGKYHPPFMGGIENFMADLMMQQVADGYNVSAIVHHHQKGKSYVEEVDKGVKIFRVPCFGQLAYAPISPSFGLYLNKIIKEQQPEILHLHMPNLSAFWCLLLASAMKIPWVIHWHADVIGSVPDMKIKLLYPFYRFFESRLLKQTQKIIATSPVYLSSSLPLQKYKKKTQIIPLGLSQYGAKVSVDETSNIGCEKDDVLKLLMVGRLTYYKGHSLIIEAIARLKSQGKTLKLNIVGTGELLNEIESDIEKFGLIQDVHLLGKLSDEDLVSEMQQCDLLCLPSIERTEAFGVVLLEAMRESKACLVSDVPGSGMSWVVKQDETGFVVKHGDVDDLVAKLTDILNNMHLLDDYAIAGFQRFSKQFSIEQVSHRVSSLYRELHSDRIF
ncbi:glycosyltransferase [Litorilituus lipolyticus]|uniref:Glycosyltransferase n=1 Tax=Litorilituus lipolyticus TaxID=2491017 RepID=A0A502L063_9GAMM|nr:glycosyltransferase [Litorilituus lipolyticus]TPH17066.1 glycosyltransferase [Litorilituus lipolyticus]